MNEERRTAAIAMSGGVDSTVAAYLLKAAGYDTAGFTLSLYEGKLEALSPQLSSEDVARDAAEAAMALGLPHYTVDLSAEFRRDVVDPFAETYCAGGTPNPCITCNRCLKFGALRRESEARGYRYLATGHYARIERSPGGRMLIYRAKDASKDQTYMLWSIDRAGLDTTLFPLGGLLKSEVREIAKAIGAVSASRKDSQDICFIPSGNYVDFIERYTRRQFPEGDFLSADGRVLGRHKGIIRYTVGQRKGLGIALGEPMYVARKDATANTVTLTDNAGLYQKRLEVRDVNLLALDRIDAPMRVEAKIRYSQETVPATVVQTGERTLSVELDAPQRAVTPGQSFVMYEDDCLLGGGIIV